MKSATLGAARLSPRGGGGAPSGWASLWECRAARSRQARPEEAQGGELGRCQGGHFERDAAHQLRVQLGRGIEAKARADVLVLEVAIDGLGQPYDTRLEPDRREVLGDQRGVCVRVISTDDDQTVEPLLVRVRVWGLGQGQG